jgi:hypothetical protein
MAMELTEGEVFDLLDAAVGYRYGGDVAEFMIAWEEGTASQQFPGCEDLFPLAEALESV